jgi:hypothetical protein
VQNDFNAPAPGRYCRLQILAFLVLNMLGSCVHVPPGDVTAQSDRTTQSDLQAPVQVASKMAAITAVQP